MIQRLFCNVYMDKNVKVIFFAVAVAFAFFLIIEIHNFDDEKG